MIITDEARLRIQCVDVLPEEVSALREELESELKRSEYQGRPGIGLSAPQIGIAKKMAIVRIPSKGAMFSLDLVNCEIAHGYDKAVFESEGCLSFPNFTAKTMRYQEIHVIKNLIEPYGFIAKGLIAVCIQHELDHLCGILLPDVALKK